jgi:hypothetical protein
MIMAVEMAGANLKLKYRQSKPKGRNKANYSGNSGKPLHKHTQHPDIHGIKRKLQARNISRKR